MDLRTPLRTLTALLQRGDWLVLATVLVAHASAVLAIAQGNAAAPKLTPPIVMQVAWHGQSRSDAPTPPPPRIHEQAKPRPGKVATPNPAPLPVPALLATSTRSEDSPSLVQEPAKPETAAPNTHSAAHEVSTTSHANREASVETSEPSFRADYLANPAPPYPRLSRELREQGRVLLRVHVASDGLATEVQVHQSSGFERLDSAALQAVHGWKFVPAKRGSESVPAWVIVPIEFTLRNRLS